MLATLFGFPLMLAALAWLLRRAARDGAKLGDALPTIRLLRQGAGPIFAEVTIDNQNDSAASAIVSARPAARLSRLASGEVAHRTRRTPTTHPDAVEVGGREVRTWLVPVDAPAAHAVRAVRVTVRIDQVEARTRIVSRVLPPRTISTEQTTPLFPVDATEIPRLAEHAPVAQWQRQAT